MAIIAPFRGLTYNFKDMQNPEKVMAPPYDVISEEEQTSFYQAAPHNVIRLILGKKNQGDSDWDNRYTRASDFFQKWQSQGTLLRNDRPCLYLTSLSYHPVNGASPRVRWGFIALARIEDEDSDVILPHEKTFSAHKDDRLMLMRTCHAQFSQIFGLYEDSDDHVLGDMKKITHQKPLVSFEFKDGTLHRMWVIQDVQIFKNVANAMKMKSIFIADGHHRYETSRNYRNLMRSRYGHRSGNRSYEYVTMYLCNMDDAGLTILPSHRLIRHLQGFKTETFLKDLAAWFEITSLPYEKGVDTPYLSALSHRLEDKGRQAPTFGFYHYGEDRLHLLSTKPGAADALGEEIHPALKNLDVILLTHLIFEKKMGLGKEDMDNEALFHYESSLAATLSKVESEEFQMAFLLNPTKMSHVKEVARNRQIMPRKSTYFFPKTLTGLVFNKIDPYESILTF
jgi:uncharacterized protein (DUF1015 family)